MRRRIRAATRPPRLVEPKRRRPPRGVPCVPSACTGWRDRRSSAGPCSASTPPRGPAARQPPGGEQRREREAHRRRGASQPVPVHPEAWDERPLDRRRRLEHLGGDRPSAGAEGIRRELRLAVLRGRRAQAVYQSANLDLCERSLRRRHGSRPVLQVQPQGERGGGRRLRGRELVDHRPRLLSRRFLSRAATTGPSSSPTTRGTASG